MSTSARERCEARYYSPEGDRVRCSLCPHSCLIGPGARGKCGVRENRDGRLYSLIYGLASSIHPDPIEKKPFFHFLPGSTSISFGSVGCNLSCTHCQNYSISRSSPEDFDLTLITPDDVVGYARSSGASSVSWTYNEPTIWHEFTAEASAVAHSHGLKTNYVTNGYIQIEPLKELSGLIDAMNIDVKAFRDDFYKRICGGRLEPVLRACEMAVSLRVHVELTYLVIPGLNDGDEELKDFSEWVAGSLGIEIPVHFSAFHPDYRLRDVPRTPTSTLTRAYDIARKQGLEFVYLGNVFAGDKDDTFCPKCGSLAVRREGFSASLIGLRGSRCEQCGFELNMITS